MNTTFFLSWLLTSIQEQTGSPRYREVSTVLECAHVAYGHEMPMVGEEALRKAHTRYMKESPFRELLSKESKKNLLIGAVIVVAIKFLFSGQIPKSSSPAETAGESFSHEDLVQSLDEIFGKSDNSSES